MPGVRLSRRAMQVRNQASVLGQLFDLMDNSYLFVKDLNHSFVRCNRALWLQFGLESEDQMLGKTDLDFFPEAIARDFVAHDKRVMRTGEPIYDDVWLVPSRKLLHWYRIDKLPIFDAPDSTSRSVIGVAGLMVPYGGEGSAPPAYDRLKPAITLANREWGRGVTVARMALATGLSMNQFTRAFRGLFQIRPVDYLIRLRLEQASHMLRGNEMAIANIASECGFFDQSAFTKTFRKHNGVTPLQYRQRYRR